MKQKAMYQDKNVLTKRVEPRKFRIITAIVACHFIKNILLQIVVNPVIIICTFVVWIERRVNLQVRAPG